MSGREASTARVVLSPVHLVRAGDGLDAIHLQARGFGLVIGTFGLRRVRGALDCVVFHRFRTDRCRALFVGLGLGWASVPLAPRGRLQVPAVARLAATLPRAVPRAPRLDLELTVTPPEPP